MIIYRRYGVAKQGIELRQSDALRLWRMTDRAMLFEVDRQTYLIFSCWLHNVTDPGSATMSTDSKTRAATTTMPDTCDVAFPPRPRRSWGRSGVEIREFSKTDALGFAASNRGGTVPHR